MIKKVDLFSKLGIEKGMLILLDDEYYPIEEVHSNKGILTVTLNDLELTIDDSNFEDYEFLKLEDNDEEITKTVVYGCKHCNQDIGFETYESAKEHTKQCLFNEANKKCVMCKHLKITMRPPYPHNAHQYLTEDMYHAFQSYNQPYCMLKDMELKELDVFADHEDCFELDTDTPVIERSEEYDKWVELSTKVDDLKKQEEDGVREVELVEAELVEEYTKE